MKCRFCSNENLTLFIDLGMSPPSNSFLTIEQLNIEKTLSEIKEKLLAERKQMPVVNLKDSPSLALVFLMLVQLITQYDNVIKDFFKIF